MRGRRSRFGQRACPRRETEPGGRTSELNMLLPSHGYPLDSTGSVCAAPGGIRVKVLFLQSETSEQYSSEPVQSNWKWPYFEVERLEPVERDGLLCSVKLR
ncbi:hypothetical protein NQZ68_027079 [Dissostichus eleginoides]|nr:hypothetical protein NQZ68_027079 [Dissostichus eleginoides]